MAEKVIKIPFQSNPVLLWHYTTMLCYSWTDVEFLQTALVFLTFWKKICQQNLVKSKEKS